MIIALVNLFVTLGLASNTDNKQIQVLCQQLSQISDFKTVKNTSSIPISSLTNSQSVHQVNLNLTTCLNNSYT